MSLAKSLCRLFYLFACWYISYAGALYGQEQVWYRGAHALQYRYAAQPGAETLAEAINQLAPGQDKGDSLWVNMHVTPGGHIAQLGFGGRVQSIDTARLRQKLLHVRLFEPDLTANTVLFSYYLGHQVPAPATDRFLYQPCTPLDGKQGGQIAQWVAARVQQDLSRANLLATPAGRCFVRVDFRGPSVVSVRIVKGLTSQVDRLAVSYTRQYLVEQEARLMACRGEVAVVFSVSIAADPYHAPFCATNTDSKTPA